jgi:hypothetical protein
VALALAQLDQVCAGWVEGGRAASAVAALAGRLQLCPA